MKIQAELIIRASPDTLWHALHDHAKRCQWQAGLDRIEMLSGTGGEPGAVAKLTYSGSRAQATVLETITDARRPDFSARVLEHAKSRQVLVHNLERASEQARFFSAKAFAIALSMTCKGAN